MHHRLERTGGRVVEPEVGERDRPDREPPDREAGPVGRERREHRVQPRAVGEPRVDHRRRAIEPEPERRDDPLGDADDGVGVELAVDRFDASATLDEHAVRAVHHDLGDGRVGEQRL